MAIQDEVIPQDPAQEEKRREEYRAIIAEGDAPDVADMKQAAFAGRKQQADRWARVLQLSRRTGYSVHYVDRNFDRMAQEEKRLTDLEYSKIQRSSPRVAEAMKDPRTAPLLGDREEIERFRKIEELDGTPASMPWTDEAMLQKAKRVAKRRAPTEYALGNSPATVATEELGDFLSRAEQERMAARQRGEVVEQITEHDVRSLDPAYIEQFYGPSTSAYWKAQKEEQARRVERLKQRMGPEVLASAMKEIEGRPAAIAKLEEQITERELARLKAINAFVAREDTIKPGEAISQTGILDYLPFTTGLSDIGKYAELMNAAWALDQGNASDEQKDVLEEFARIEEAEARRGKAWTTRLSEGALALPSFIGELALTAGVYTGVKTLILKGGKEAAEGLLRRSVRAILSRTAGVLAQAPIAAASRIPATALRRQFENKEGAGEAWGKAVLDSIIEVGSERLSGPLTGAGKWLFAKWAAKQGAEATESAFRKVVRAAFVGAKPLTKIGIHGAPVESIEERAANLAKSILGIEEWQGIFGPDPGVELALFTALPAGSAALEQYHNTRPEVREANARRAESIAAAHLLGGQILQESTAGKTPEASEELAGRIMGPGTVLVPIKAFQQPFEKKGEDPRQKAQDLKALESYNEALITGGFVEIPRSLYMTKLMTSENAAHFANEMKEHPQAWSVREVKEDREKLKKIADSLKAKEKPDTERKLTPTEESAKRVGEGVAEQLRKTGRYTDEQIETYVKGSVEPAYRRFADESGLTPEEVAAQFPVTIQLRDNEEGFEQRALGDLTPSEKKFFDEIFGSEADRAEFLEEVPSAKYEGGRLTVAREDFDKLSNYVDDIVRTDEAGSLPPSFHTGKFSFRGPTYRQGDKTGPSDDVVDAAFAKIAEQVWSEKLKPRQAIPFSRTPASLQILGAPDLPMTITAEVILKARNDHNLTPEIIQNLPKQIRDPLMIFESRTEPNALVVLTEVMFKGKAVVAAVHVERGEEHFKVNRIASVHDRPVEHIGNWMGQDLLRYWDEKRAKAWLMSAGVQSPGEGAKPSGKKVLSKSDLIKYEQKGYGRSGRASYVPKEQTDTGVAQVNLKSVSDLTSFIHEFCGHHYLEVIVGLSDLPKASDKLKKNVQTIFSWLGIKDKAEWDALGFEGRRKYHEQFAEGFESYFMRGKAPSSALREIFSTVRRWFVAVYQTLKGHVELPADVVEVFNRILASDAEIAAMKEQQGMSPLLENMKQSGMSEARAQEYVDTIEKGDRVATEKMDQAFLADINREQTKEWKQRKEEVRQEVTAEVDKLPEYVAASVLEFGTLPNGKAVPEALGGLKLNEGGLKGLYGDVVAQSIPDEMKTKEGGADADYAAQALGFTSGEQLVTLLTQLENKGSLVERLTMERMAERYPSPELENLPESTLVALHNEHNAKRLRMEMEWLVSGEFAKFKGLLQRIVGRIPSDAELRADAVDHLSQEKTFGTLNPDLYRKGSEKAAKEALELFLKGDYQGAFEAKRRELVNAERHSVAVELKKAMRDGLAYLRGFNKQSTQERIAKAGAEFYNQIEALRERYNLRPASIPKLSERIASLREFYDGQRALGFEPAIDPILFMETRAKNWNDIPIEEFLGVVDAVKSIDHLATRSGLLQSLKKRVEFNEAIESLVATAEKNRLPANEQTDAGLKTWRDRFKKGLVTADLALLPMESIIEMLDGGPVGPWHDLLWNRSSEAQSDFLDQSKALQDVLVKQLDSYMKADPSRLTERLETPLGPMSRLKLMSIAFNVGNESSFDKQIRGEGWERKEALVMQAVGLLNRKDLEYIQETWTTINSLFPKLSELQERIGGIPLEKLEARPFTVRLKDGTEMRLAGGYWPAVYDRARSNVGELQESRVLEGLTESGYVPASIPSSARK